MIQLNNLGVKTENSRVLLDALCASIYPGDFIILIGANGAGKTTLFNLLSGALTPSQGTMRLKDNGIEQPLGAHMVSRVYQNPLQGTAASLSVRENLALALYRNHDLTLRQAELIVDNSSLLEKVQHYFPEPHFLERKIGTLSGGQRQLLAFFMATAYPTPLLLLDEPTAALDPAATLLLMNAVQEVVYQKKTAVILITHDINLVYRYGTKLWVLSKGRLLHMLNAEQKYALNNEAIGEYMNPLE